MNNIKLRLLQNSTNDYQLLYKWYHNPQVYTYFEQRIPTYDEIVTKYSKRTSTKSITPVYIIEYNDIPVGIIQYTKVSKDKYNTPKDDYDIDIFIGEENYYHKGIGSTAIRQLIDTLRDNNHVFTMIPEAENTNAINCYQKVGFKEFKKITEENTIGIPKEKIIMIYER